ncbi:hypothetical protein [Pseudomonas viridiflava]|uniref:hypothetical protein n=1 Tax=Pseudomonas viridiflava TaxID=33069 RepID=UPI0013CEF714|nr:hypothetical protein [Pseudomonas viridiflava]
MRLNNPAKRELLRTKVDGCLIVEGKRCDWMIVDRETGTEVFIELKGCDVLEGVKQLGVSVNALSKRAAKKYGYVICTRSPISSPVVQRLQKELLKTHSLHLRVKRTIHTEDIDSLIL